MMGLSEHIAGRNGKDVFEIIRRYQMISKQEIQQQIGFPMSTLTRVLDELLAKGLILGQRLGPSTGGRRPILYQTNPTYGYVFGLDISRANSKLVLCDMQLNILDHASWKMTSSMTPQALLHHVKKEVIQLQSTHKIEPEKVLGIGIGAVGPLDRASGVILNPQHFAAPGWEHIHIGEWVNEQLGINCVLDNGANCALLAEYWLDRDSNIQHMLYVHAGVGIRSAMIVGGDLVYGAVDMEGAVGQMIVHYDGSSLSETSDNHGTWESHVSTSSLLEQVEKHLQSTVSTTLHDFVSKDEPLTFSKIEKALLAGDETVRELFYTSSCYFGVGLANLLNILHPEKVVLGGPLIANNDVYYDNATNIALQKTYHAPIYDVKFEKSRWGEDAVAVGAAVSLIRQMTL